MELQTVDLASLHFPRTEWKWLRASARYPTSPETAPDAFLWAARVGDALWAWHPEGSDLSTGFAGMKTRVLILATDGSEIAAHGLYLKTSFFTKSARDVEWVAALDVLAQRLGVDLAQKGLSLYWREALEASGLEAHLGILAQRGRYMFLTQSERQVLFDKNWDLSTFEMLETVNVELRGHLIEAIRRWNLTAANAKEAINNVMMMTRKLGEKAAITMVTGQFKSTEEFRVSLMRMAQPELAQLSQKRLETLRSLHMPARTSVFGDPTFEKDVLKITHTPRNIGDFESFKQWVEDPELTEKMRELLEIYQ